MKDHLYTARYYILKSMPEGAAKVALLALMRPVLGPEPVWYVAGGADAPEVLPDLEKQAPGVPSGIRIALVVGHNEDGNQGAWLKPPLSESEFVFWSKVFGIVAARGIPGTEIRVFFRHHNRRGYGAEIDAAYTEVKRWKPHLCKEGHFNGGNADHGFILVGKGRDLDARIAARSQSIFAERLGIRSLGVIERTKGERGGRSLFATGKVPTSMTEHWFGDNAQHARKIADLGHEGVAEIMVDCLTQELKELYRLTPDR